MKLKKVIPYLAMILLLVIPMTVFANTPSRSNLEYIACGEAGGIPGPIPQLTSALYTLLIIATPIILVIFSIVALVKAITAGSQDDIMKAKNKVIKKFISAALVFFIAGLVQFVITKAADSSEKNSIVKCIDCFLYHENCEESTSGNDVIIQEPSDHDFEMPSSTGTTSSSNPSSSGSSSTIYTSTKTNIKYNVYNQTDSRWNEVKYSNGEDTIGEIGCMITSVAVVSSAHDNTITPKTVFDKYPHSHPSTSVPTLSNNNFTCSFGSTTSSDIKQNLQNGNVVIIKVYGSKKGGSSSFTSSQHYMALIDINSSGEQIYVGNAYSSSGHGKSGWFSSSEVLTSVQTAEVCVPSSSLKAKYNSSGSQSSKGTNSILVGDSRTVGICQYANTTLNVGKCRDYLTVSQGGMGYNWFKNTAISNVNTLLNQNSGTKFNIVILLGVNDISNTTYWADAAVNEYITAIKAQANGAWKNHNIIFTSVTPLGAESTGGDWPVTQTNINYFNSQMKSKINSLGLSNVSYCDINSGLNLSGKIASDNIHYTTAGYTEVYNQVKNKCL